MFSKTIKLVIQFGRRQALTVNNDLKLRAVRNGLMDSKYILKPL